MAQIGYVRVSTAVQDGALQRDALANAGCVRFFEDKASDERMQAISGALTLLANVVMAWNTHRIQAFRDQNPDELTDKVLAQLAPIAHAHINMRGIISFRLEKAAKGLIVPPKRPDRSAILHKI